MKFARFIGFNGLIAVAFLLVCDQAWAGYVPLPSDMGTLTAQGAYTGVGSYTYTFVNFTSSSTESGDAVAADAVHVTGVTVPNPGFELTGAFASPGQSQNDIAFGYTVSTTGPGMTSISLNANGATLGGGIAQITETVYTDQTRTTLLGQLLVTTGTKILQLGGAYKSLFITEDILFNTYNAGDSASFSIINQTFAIPEPTSVVLMGLGLVGVGIASRRRSRSAVAAH